MFHIISQYIFELIIKSICGEVALNYFQPSSGQMSYNVLSN